MQLDGLQKLLDLGTGGIKIEGQAWRDLDVATWDRIEIDVGGAIQTDTYVHCIILLL